MPCMYRDVQRQQGVSTSSYFVLTDLYPAKRLSLGPVDFSAKLTGAGHCRYHHQEPAQVCSLGQATIPSAWCLRDCWCFFGGWSKCSGEQRAVARSTICLTCPLSVTSGSHKHLTFPPKKRLFLNLRIKKAMKKVPSMRMRERRAVLGCILIPSDIASAVSMLAFRLFCTLGG